MKLIFDYNFQLRTFFLFQIEEEDLDKIEDCVIDAFVSLVFKLSESQFKPMLIQVYFLLFICISLLYFL